MRESSRATTWTCDNQCGAVQVLTDGYQDAPPEGWRLIQLLPKYVNRALEPNSKNEIKTKVLCDGCFDTLVAGVFADE